MWALMIQEWFLHRWELGRGSVGQDKGLLINTHRVIMIFLVGYYLNRKINYYLTYKPIHF